MTNSPLPADDSPSPWRTRLGCAAAIGAVVLLLVAVPLSIYVIAMSRGRRELAAEVQRLRARGSALTTVELNQQYHEREVADHVRAGQELIAAFALLNDPTLRESAKTLPIVGGPETPALHEPWPDQQAAEDYLARCQRTLALIKAFSQSQQPVRYSVDFTPGIYTLLPHVQQLRDGVRIVQLQFHIDVRSGRTDDAIQRLEEMVYLGETLRDEPFLVSQLVRMAVLGVALFELNLLLEHARLTDPQLAKLQSIFRPVQMQPGLLRALEGERATGYTACTWPIQPLMDGTSAQPISNEEIARLANRPPSNPGNAALMLQLFRRLQEASEESLADAAQEAEAITVELKQLNGSHQRLLYLQTLLLFPAVQASLRAFQRTDARCQAADACLAALRYRQANQTWPASLAQLTPEFLPAVPLDPYVNKPMLFQATAIEFKVYAVGEDQTDNGGVWTDIDLTDVGFVVKWREEAP